MDYFDSDVSYITKALYTRYKISPTYKVVNLTVERGWKTMHFGLIYELHYSMLYIRLDTRNMWRRKLYVEARLLPWLDGPAGLYLRFKNCPEETCDENNSHYKYDGGGFFGDDYGGGDYMKDWPESKDLIKPMELKAAETNSHFFHRLLNKTRDKIMDFYPRMKVLSMKYCEGTGHRAIYHGIFYRFDVEIRAMHDPALQYDEFANVCKDFGCGFDIIFEVDLFLPGYLDSPDLMACRFKEKY